MRLEWNSRAMRPSSPTGSGSVASNVCDAPLIGLTTYAEQARHGAWDEMSALLPMEYVTAVIRAGGTPLLLPPSPVDRVGVLDALSGLVLTGGPDVDPA